jgi:hypothetical protein
MVFKVCVLLWVAESVDYSRSYDCILNRLVGFGFEVTR